MLFAIGPTKRALITTLGILILSCSSEAIYSKTSPEYINLAFQPAAPTPLANLPGDLWVVQLAAVSNIGGLQDFVTSHQLPGLTGAAFAKDGEQLYALLLGVYETRARAERAAATRPKPLTQFTPWIRPLSALQELMPTAD